MAVNAEPVLREFEALPPEERESIAHEVLQQLFESAMHELVRAALQQALEKRRETSGSLSTTQPTRATLKERPLGPLRGQFKVPDDFDDPLPDELLRAFEGEE
jgi:hypothetical protein